MTGNLPVWRSSDQVNAETLVDLAGTLNCNQGQRGGILFEPSTAGKPMSVRHLTPREAERVQGFPDDWTLVLWGGKSSPDTLRYKALGNSMAVPVVRWIGERLAETASWRRVVHADECDEWDNCPVCVDVDFADCPCPGPTQDDLYEYREDEDGTLWAKPLKKEKTP